MTNTTTVRFIQICSDKNSLYGLDKDGHVWEYHFDHWQLLTDKGRFETEGVE